MRPPPPPQVAGSRGPHHMDPRAAVAFGMAGILLALAVLGLSWHSTSAGPAGAQDARPASTAHASTPPAGRRAGGTP